MIVTISGVPGSGKTSVGKKIAEKLGFPFYSVGGLRGKMALERGMTLDELNTLGETDKSTDSIVDDYQKELGAKEDNFVIEGRLSWYFIPHSFKIFLDCNIDEATRRIMSSKDDRPDEHLPAKIDAVKRLTEERMASDMRRYKKYYGLNYTDKSHYDLFIDTTPLKSVDESVNLVLEALRPRLDV
ncbi:MAG: cytidylate kinase family protein [Patescibacteria group bacterium]|jgi:cytidylate kinase